MTYFRVFETWITNLLKSGTVSAGHAQRHAGYLKFNILWDT